MPRNRGVDPGAETRVPMPRQGGEDGQLVGNTSAHRCARRSSGACGHGICYPSRGREADVPCRERCLAHELPQPSGSGSGGPIRCRTPRQGNMRREHDDPQGRCDPRKVERRIWSGHARRRRRRARSNDQRGRENCARRPERDERTRDVRRGHRNRHRPRPSRPECRESHQLGHPRQQRDGLRRWYRKRPRHCQADRHRRPGQLSRNRRRHTQLPRSGRPVAERHQLGQWQPCE